MVCENRHQKKCNCSSSGKPVLKRCRLCTQIFEICPQCQGIRQGQRQVDPGQIKLATNLTQVFTPPVVEANPKGTLNLKDVSSSIWIPSENLMTASPNSYHPTSMPSQGLPPYQPSVLGGQLQPNASLSPNMGVPQQNLVAGPLPSGSYQGGQFHINGYSNLITPNNNQIGPQSSYPHNGQVLLNLPPTSLPMANSQVVPQQFSVQGGQFAPRTHPFQSLPVQTQLGQTQFGPVQAQTAQSLQGPQVYPGAQSLQGPRAYPGALPVQTGSGQSRLGQAQSLQGPQAYPGAQLQGPQAYPRAQLQGPQAYPRAQLQGQSLPVHSSYYPPQGQTTRYQQPPSYGEQANWESNIFEEPLIPEPETNWYDYLGDQNLYGDGLGIQQPPASHPGGIRRGHPKVADRDKKPRRAVRQYRVEGGGGSWDDWSGDSCSADGVARRVIKETRYRRGHGGHNHKKGHGKHDKHHRHHGKHH